MANWSLFCRHIWKVPCLLFLSPKSHYPFASHYVPSAFPLVKLMASSFPPFSYFPLDSPAPLSFTDLCSCVHYFSSCPATCTASVWPAVCRDAPEHYAPLTYTTPASPCRREWLIQHSHKHGPGPCSTPLHLPAVCPGPSLPLFCGCHLLCFSVSSSNFPFLWPVSQVPMSYIALCLSYKNLNY